jgi:alpha-amylase/alpha-mannosidase (GH57 family)
MTQPIYLALIWHMHQPYYRDMVTGECSMPWVRLHATKDYLDMVKRLDRFPTIHQTFNLVPSLLDQLEEYLPPANRTDEFLELSKKPAAALTEQEKRFTLQWFFLANLERMIRPFPRYHDLLAKRGLQVNDDDWPRVQKRFRTQDYLDLQVWFNLAWIDPWLRSSEPKLAKLEAKGGQFTEEEKRDVLEQHLALMAQVIPAYRDAAARGQIELATSPYYHPIMPLLCDVRSAHVALPNLPLPETRFRHPEDARWQLQQGLLRHQAAFGAPPTGVWPPEGSVSEEFVKLALESNVRWIATDEAILWRTLKISKSRSALYRPYLLRRKAGRVAIVFRDRELSDLIGFVYSQWDPKIAVADFLKRLGDIHQQFRTSGHPALVSIILDGENAWEFYPNDGHEFLTMLYQALRSDDRFRCVTVSELLQQYPLEQTEPLPELFSGSWIDGNFATWIGHPEKNAAWGHLSNAREAFGPHDSKDPSLGQAWKSLGAAEGSDWMWWFGDTHFSAQAEKFDRLFRVHLANAYQLAGLEAPATLQTPIKRQVSKLLYEPTGLIHPTIDGRETSYYEWLYAGRLDLKQQYSAIQRSEQCLRYLYYGFDQSHQYVRVDLDPAMLARLSAWAIDLTLSHGVHVQITPDAKAIRAHVLTPASAVLPCALAHILEVAVPMALLRLESGEKLQLAITLTQGGELLERYPAQGTFELNASTTDLEAQAWSV